MANDSRIDDVPQLGLAAGLASLGYVFWVCGAMEMVERLAYYGVAGVRALYATNAVSAGGLGLTMDQYGDIVATWALVQCILPVFTGGLSDRFGYKQTIAISTAVKIAGYLLMAFVPTYAGFLSGALVLATGTAIFKPGIQGTVVRATKRENSSLAWGIFYQTVNIGGWLGPLLAGYLRKLAWQHVFLACAAIICLNFLLILVYKEPTVEQPAEKKNLAKESLQELARPHVWPYLLIFSGFWFMFMSLYDVLPNAIEDWVDTNTIVRFIFGAGKPEGLLTFFVDLNKEGTQILPEGMINVDAFLIMTTCFLFGWLSGKMSAITSMAIGTVLSSFAMLMFGFSVGGVMTFAGIAVFAVGEMLSSPKFSEYIGNFAPQDKKAMYLGFSQIPLAIGWTLEGKLAPKLYGMYGSKETFARELLQQKGLAEGVPQGEAFTKLVEVLHSTPEATTQMLLQTHDPGVVWLLMAGIGFASAVGMVGYGRWVKSLRAAGRL